jgi:hypothetical protein
MGYGFCIFFFKDYQLDEILGPDASGLGQTLVSNCQIQLFRRPKTVDRASQTMA